jgi:hypothetical protein
MTIVTVTHYPGNLLSQAQYAGKSCNDDNDDRFQPLSINLMYF